MRILILCRTFGWNRGSAGKRMVRFARYLQSRHGDVHIISESYEGSWSEFASVDYPDPALRPPRSSHRILGRIARIVRDCARYPDLHAGFAKFATERALALYHTDPPDVILCSVNPVSLLRSADILSGKWGIPWVVDYRDLWSFSPYRSVPRWRRRLDQRFVERHARSASSATAVSPGLAESVSAWHSDVHVLWSGLDFPKEDAGKREDSSLPHVISHTGNLYDARRNPAPLFEALNRFEQSEARQFRVVFHGMDSHQLASLFRKQAGQADVHAHGFVSHEESVRIQESSFINVLLTWNDPRTQSTITGKVFEYIQAGRPILHIGNPDNEAARLLERTGAGVTLNDPVSIAAFIQSIMAGNWSMPARASLEPYLIQHQGQRLLDLLERVVSRNRD